MRKVGRHEAVRKPSRIRAAAVALALGGAVVIGSAGVETVETPADVIHPDIHQNVTDGNNANPNGVSPAGGAKLHGIGNVPGQGGDHPNDDGVKGFANELTDVHGGIDEVNPQAD